MPNDKLDDDVDPLANDEDAVDAADEDEDEFEDEDDEEEEDREDEGDLQARRADTRGGQ